MVGLTVSLQIIRKIIDPSVELLVFSGVFILLLVKFVLKCIYLSPKCKLSILFLSFLFFLVSDKVLYLLVFISK